MSTTASSECPFSPAAKGARLTFPRLTFARPSSSCCCCCCCEVLSCLGRVQAPLKTQIPACARGRAATGGRARAQDDEPLTAGLLHSSGAAKRLAGVHLVAERRLAGGARCLLQRLLLLCSAQRGRTPPGGRLRFGIADWDCVAPGAEFTVVSSAFEVCALCPPRPRPHSHLAFGARTIRESCSPGWPQRANIEPQTQRAGCVERCSGADCSPSGPSLLEPPVVVAPLPYCFLCAAL